MGEKSMGKMFDAIFSSSLLSLSLKEKCEEKSHNHCIAVSLPSHWQPVGSERLIFISSRN